MTWVCGCIVVGSLLLLAHSLFSLYLMLYAWDQPQCLASAKAPESFLPPQLSFSVLLPARSEERVIYRTIQAIAAANYPRELLEIIVICHADDEATIREVQRAIASLEGRSLPPVRLEAFAGQPINKPRALNAGFRRAGNAVVAVFDAEDDINPDIFNVVNSLMVSENCRIVQGGVQLMNFADHWFSIHNVLEYYFHYKSRLLCFARAGATPLGGNTAFIRRELIEGIGGWDELCLTEDADIGLRLSERAEPVRVIYDPRYVTREETPPTTASLVRQRTRWNQGFLQILTKRHWRRLPRWGQRLLALYALSYPVVQAVFTLAWPLTVVGWIWLKLPVVVAMTSWLPMLVLAIQLVVTLVGARLFLKEFGLKAPLLLPIRLTLTFLPFHMLMGFSAVRALYRQIRRRCDWEKTAHVGAHRPSVSECEPAQPATAEVGMTLDCAQE